MSKKKNETRDTIQNIKNENVNLKKTNKNKLPKWVILVVIAAIFMFLIIVALTGYSIYYDLNEDKIMESKIKEDLKFTDSVKGSYDAKNNTYIITGYIKNVSDKRYENITVNYTLYDNNNNIVGIARAYLEGLSKNKTWKFTAEYEGINAESVVRFEKSNFIADYETWLD